MKFYAKKINGELVFDRKDDLKRLFDDVPEGEGVELKVMLSKDIRKLEMNNLYWWWLSLLSDHSGYTKREIHNYLKKELLCIESEVNGSIIDDCPSTSDLSIKEFSAYLQQVARLAAQNFNFILPESR